MSNPIEEAKRAHEALDAIFTDRDEGDAEGVAAAHAAIDSLAAAVAGGGHARNCRCCPKMIGMGYAPEFACRAYHCHRPESDHPYTDPRCSLTSGGHANYDGLQVRFDGPPSHESGRFIELETLDGKSTSAGEWVQDGEDWLLKIPRCCQPRPELPSREAIENCIRGTVAAYYVLKPANLPTLEAIPDDLIASVAVNVLSLLRGEGGSEAACA